MTFCDCIVKHDKKFFIDSHRSSMRHSVKLKTNSATSSQQFITGQSITFAQQVTKSFLSANIPLYKLRHPAISDLFKVMGQQVPSEATCRNYVPELFGQEKQRMIDYVYGKQIFLIVDESDIEGNKFFNILVGITDVPHQTYLWDCITIQHNINNQFVTQTIDDAIHHLIVERRDFVLLISDAASYMIPAGETLKIMYPHLFHITCVTHLLHNCAMIVKSANPSINNLISSIKSATIKNSDRRMMFYEIGLPPKPVVTRWGTWLRAAFWYAKHLPAVREIVNNFESDGLLTARAKEAVAVHDLPQNLLNILQYKPLVDMISKTESSHYSICDAMIDFGCLDFERDYCNIGPYIKKRMEKNDITSIIEMKNIEVPPKTYALLQKCQASSAAVERSFSMMNYILRKERNFSKENVKYYAILNYNNSI
jgi:hypothetical protein